MASRLDSSSTTCGIRVAGPSGGGHLTLPNTTGTDVFCSSQIILPQSGNIFLAGGDNWVNGRTTNTGNNNSNVSRLPQIPWPVATT